MVESGLPLEKLKAEGIHLSVGPVCSLLEEQKVV